MSQIFILIVKQWCIQDGYISFAQTLMHPRIHNICLSEFWYIQVEKICLFELVDIQIIEKILKKLKSKHKWNLSSYYEFHYSLNPEDEQGAAEGGPEASVTKTAAHARPSGLKRHLRREEAFKEGN